MHTATSKIKHYLKNKKTMFWALVYLFFSSTLNSSAQNVSTYTLSSDIRTYAALTGATNTSLGTTDDDAVSNAIILPFTFTYGGEKYSRIKVSSNGWLTFNESVTNSFPANDLTSAMAAKPIIMPLWDDLQNRVTPRYKTDGASPNRIFKIEWSESEWSKSANANVISFQVWLYENGNAIEFLYSNGGTNVSSGSATVGLYDFHATMLTLNTSTWTNTSTSVPALPAANSICHTSFTANATLSAKPANNRVFKFTPTTLSLTDRWWVHVYDNGLQGVADIDNMNSYVGYYSFKTTDFTGQGEGFKTNINNTTGHHGWAPDGTPATATGYTGCSTTAKPNSAAGLRDRYKYHFRRQGVPCGFYRVTMELLDDRAQMKINNIDRWDSDPASAGTVPYGWAACSGGCNQQIGYLYLDENSSIELRVQENTGFTGAWMGIEKISNITYLTDVIDNNNQPLCFGNSVLTMTASTPAITAVGLTGSLLNPTDVPWKYKWEKSVDGVTNWTIVTDSTRASLSPGVTNTSMHYRRKTILCGSDAGTSSFAAVVYPTGGNDFGQNGNQRTCLVNTNDWVHFYHMPGGGLTPRLLASIHSGGQNLGNVTVTSYVESSPMLVPACGAVTNQTYFTSVLDRHWVITPQFQPTSDVKIRLPFKNTEFDDLVTKSAANQNQFDNVTTVADLKLSKYSGPNNVDNNARNNCPDQGGSGGTVSNFASPANGNTANYSTNPTISIANGKFKEYTIPGFSEFWLHGQSNNSPLPITLTHFSVNCNQNNLPELRWTTESEINSMKFRIEKSRNLNHWLFVDEILAAGNSNTSIQYLLTDSELLNGLFYYRLILTDYNGTEKIYGPISFECQGKQNVISILPNPIQGEFTVQISLKEEKNNCEIQIVDLTGKVIITQNYNLWKGENQILLDAAQLANGNYFVRLFHENQLFETAKMIVIK